MLNRVLLELTWLL